MRQISVEGPERVIGSKERLLVRFEFRLRHTGAGHRQQLHPS
jgi:hypothetical protein